MRFSAIIVALSCAAVALALPVPGEDNVSYRKREDEGTIFWRDSDGSFFWKKRDDDGTIFWKKEEDGTIFWKREDDGTIFWKKGTDFWRRGEDATSYWKKDEQIAQLLARDPSGSDNILN